MKSIITCITIIFLHSGCCKDCTKPCPRGGYVFKAEGIFSPQTASYKVGDTIYFTSLIPKIQQDQINPSMTVNYENSTGILGNIGFFEFDTLSKKIVLSALKFSCFSIAGSVSPIATDNNRGFNYSYNEESIDYQLTIGIKPLQKGNFVISVLSPSSAGLRGKDCTNAGFGMTVTNSDKHIDIWQSSLGRLPDIQEEKTIYCFRVQ